MQPLYNSIGEKYTITRSADPSITSTLAQFVELNNGYRFLDVACGTGNYTAALAKIGGCWHGIDISEIMLKKAAKRTSNIQWVMADVNSIPFAARSFSGAICSLAIHHFPELLRPFQEIWRVIDQGKFVIFTAFPEQMRNYWLCHYFPEMMEKSCQNMPPKESIVKALQAAGFEVEQTTPFHVTNQLQDLFLYSGKHRPDIYFDPVVRANISSFATLCTDTELMEGLEMLRGDLDSSKFDQIAQKYSASMGDYAYIIAKKSIG